MLRTQQGFSLSTWRLAHRQQTRPPASMVWGTSTQAVSCPTRGVHATSACPLSMRLSTRELPCTCCHTMKGSDTCRCQTKSSACCDTHPEALRPMLRRFLSNNKVYPDDVIVIESGINDILVRPPVFSSDHKSMTRCSMTRCSISAFCALDSCRRTAGFHSPVGLHFSVLGRV